MNELIKITTNYNNEQVVSGRELHEFLEIKDKYPQWFARMAEYGFDEGIDFITILGKSSGGRPSQDHALKISMAKELSMIQRTEKGKQARLYFIECEEKLKQQQLPQVPTTQRGLVQLSLSAVEEANQRIDVVEDKLENLTDRFGLPATNAAILKNTRNIHIVRFLGGKNSKAYHELGRQVFSEFGKDFKNNFGVPRYDAIPLSQFDEAIAYTKSWQPSFNTMLSIRNTNMQMELD